MNKKYWFFIPISFIYGGIMEIRNLLFRYNLLKKTQTSIFSVGVGNLQVGGTGKSPHVEYLIKLFKNEKIAILSRGYGRKTTGFIEAKTGTSPNEIGDEPLQYFYKKKKNTSIFVAENRVEGYLKIKEKYNYSILLLDDSFQHQYIQPTLNLVISPFDDFFTDDFVLPAGRMREFSWNYKRADAIIVSKSPENLSNSAIHYFIEVNAKHINLPIFFSYLAYQSPISFQNTSFDFHEKVVLITGIGLPNYFNSYCSEKFNVEEKYNFKDHHVYQLNEILSLAERHPTEQFLTTEKDFVKLVSLLPSLLAARFFYLPIEVRFYEEEKFNSYVLTSFQQFSDKKSNFKV
jgi:tetraacyldisaccharide 4'-kinase